MPQWLLENALGYVRAAVKVVVGYLSKITIGAVLANSCALSVLALALSPTARIMDINCLFVRHDASHMRRYNMKSFTLVDKLVSPTCPESLHPP